MSDRKYRHQGYMDRYGSNGRERRNYNEQRSERKVFDPMLDDAPRGRSASEPGAEVFRCAGCGEILSDCERIVAETGCPRCGTDLHTCTNCKFFDIASPLECRQPIKERVTPKDRRNRCERYAPRTVLDLSGRRRSSILTGGEVSGPDDPRLAFERLFKK